MQRHTLNLNEEALTICSLARRQNKAEIAALVAKGYLIDIGLLAQAGECETVIFLIKHFNANKMDALIGAARGGHIQLIEMIDSRFTKNRTFLAKIEDYQKWLNKLAKQAVLYGQMACVEQLIKRGASKDYVIQACVEYLHQACKINEPSHNNRKKVLALLSHIKEVSLRKAIATQLCENTLGIKKWLINAELIHDDMKKYQLTFIEACALRSQPWSIHWLLQGQQLVTGLDYNGIEIREITDHAMLPPELYLHITSYVLNLSENEVGKMSVATNARRNNDFSLWDREKKRVENHLVRHESGCRIC